CRDRIERVRVNRKKRAFSVSLCLRGEKGLKGRNQRLETALRLRSLTTWSSTRCATSHFEVSGTSTTSSCEIIVTALRSESNPTAWGETSLATIASSDFAASFLRAFSSTLSVSAAKPMTICEGFL